ncbi:MAG: DUF4383 domain-containing protein [Cyanobacteria bacterium J06621_11]
MAVRYFSLVAGLVYLAFGITGVFPSFVDPIEVAPKLMAEVGVTDGLGYLYGLFPINTFEAMLYVVIGVVGLAGFVGTEVFARLYADTLAVWLGFLGLLGLVPIANTLFGLAPLYGNDVYLHLGTAAIAAYFGFFLDRGRPNRDPSVPDALKPEPLTRSPLGSES